MKKITNIKLEITEEYQQKKRAELKSKKRHLLNVTDWTQLEDVLLTEHSKSEFKNWRNKVRDTKLNGLDDVDVKTYNENIENLREQMPIPEFKNTKEQNTDDDKQNKALLLFIKRVIELEKEVNDLKNKEKEHIIVEDKEEAQKILIDKILIKNGFNRKELLAEYPLMNDYLIQAGSFLYDGGKVKKYPLLDSRVKNLNVDSKECAEQIIKDAKQFFSKIHSMEEKYLQIQKKVYNMSDEEIFNDLLEYGYRYRF